MRLSRRSTTPGAVNLLGQWLRRRAASPFDPIRQRFRDRLRRWEQRLTVRQKIIGVTVFCCLAGGYWVGLAVYTLSHPAASAQGSPPPARITVLHRAHRPDSITTRPTPVPPILRPDTHSFPITHQ